MDELSRKLGKRGKKMKLSEKLKKHLFLKKKQMKNIGCMLSVCAMLIPGNAWASEIGNTDILETQNESVYETQVETTGEDESTSEAENIVETDAYAESEAVSDTESEIESETSESTELTDDEYANEDPETFRNQRKQNNIDDNGIAMFARTVARKVTAYGIDVSEFNGTIDWKKVKNAGVNFALIRVGYRGYGTGKLVKDACVERNLREATAAGVQVGAYFYSTAITEDEAREEAQMVIDIVKNYKITYPIAFDNEGMYLINGDKQRDYDLTSAQRTDMAIAFLDTIKAAGYTPMMYGNTSCYANNDDRGFDVSRLENKYEIWVAQYFYKNENNELYNSFTEALNRSTSYDRNYSVWQFSSGGKVDGIAGNVDLDYWYEDVQKTQSAQITATQSGNKLNIQVSNIQSSYSIGKASVAVWSQNNGQDDIKWYTLTQNGATWTTSVNLENHKKDIGTYNIHLYFDDLKGKGAFASSCKVNVISSVNINIGKTTTGFSVKISNIYIPYNIKSLSVPIWSQKNGQDDIVWYQASKSGSEWTVNVDTSNHKDDTGIYYVHTYMTTSDNQFLFLKSATYDVAKVNQPTVKYNEISVADNQSNGDFTVKIANVKANYTINKISFAVWSGYNGQDDIKWYTAVKNGTTWSVNVKGSEHNYESGIYYIHAYFDDNSGKGHFASSLSQNIKAEVPGNIITVGNVNSNTSQFSVQLSSVKTNNKVASVVIPVWTSKNGQDDIVWYEAQKNGNNWSITVDCAKHNYESGIYNIHIYYRDTKGGFHFLTAATKNMTVPQKAKNTGTISVSKTTASTFRITIDNVSCATGIKKIYVPTWTNKNGQDDLIWYQPVYRNGQWVVNVSIANHKRESGIYNIHLYYEDNNGKMNLVSAKTFQFQ